MPSLGESEAPIAALGALIPMAILGAHALAGAALVVWARRVARARGGAWRLAPWPPAGAAFLPLLGLVVTVMWLLRAFASVGALDPASRSAALAQGIAEAMNVTGFALVAAWAIYVATAIALAVARFTRAPG